MLERLRGHRTTLVLAVLAGVLALVVLWDRGRISTDEAADRRLQLLDAWRQDQVTELTIEDASGRVRLVRQSGPGQEEGWQLEQGAARLTTDEQAVADLLLTLQYAAFERRVAGLDRAGLGLDHPRLTIELGMGALRYALRLGAEAPSPAGARYLEVQGGARPTTQYVVGKELVEALERQPKLLRSRRLVPYLSPDVESYALEGAHRFRLGRGGWGGRSSGDFLLEADAPIGKVRADWRSVDGFVTALGRLEAESFLPLAEAAAAQQRAATHTLTVRPRDRSRPEVVLVLGGRCPRGAGVAVVRKAFEPTGACASDKSVAAVLFDPEPFADRYVFGTVDTEVTDLSITGGEVTVDIARKGEGWTMRRPEPGAVDDEAATALLGRLLEAEGERLSPSAAVDLGGLGLDPPRATVRLGGLPDRSGGPGAAERTEEVTVGAEVEGHVHVRRRDDGALLRLAPDVATALLPMPAVLRPAQIYDVDRSDLRGLELDCDGKRQRLKSDIRGNWTMTAPEAPVGADIGLANELADLVRQLSAVRWVSEQAGPAHGLDPPFCLIGLVVATRDERGEAPPRGDHEPRHTLKLRLGAETGGGYFATRDDLPAVFVAPRVLGQLARGWLLDRAALVPATADVDRIELAQGDRVLVVARRSDRWVMADAAPQAANDARAATVGGGVEKLVAEAVTAIGAEATEATGPTSATLTIHLRSRPKAPRRLAISGPGTWRAEKAYFVREQGVEATFAVSAPRLQPLLDAL